jgi:hypothetical protein
VRFRSSPISTGKLIARLDMSGWSSWARADQPARLVFTPATLGVDRIPLIWEARSGCASRRRWHPACAEGAETTP